MKNNALKASVIIGTAALLWSIPSVNIFGVAGDIMSWAAYSGGKKSSAKGAAALYIIALIISILFGVALILAGKAIDLGQQDLSGLSSFMNGAAAVSFIGDALYAAAAVTSVKGGKDLKGSNGFFD